MSFTIAMPDGSQHEVKAGSKYTNGFKFIVEIKAINFQSGIAYVEYVEAGLFHSYEIRTFDFVSKAIGQGRWVMWSAPCPIIPAPTGTSVLAHLQNINRPTSTIDPQYQQNFAPKTTEPEFYCTSTYNPSKDYDDRHGDW